MNNFIQPGTTITTPAPAGGVESGQAFLVGGLLVVSGVKAAEGVQIDAAAEGVFRLPCVTTAIAQGVDLYWDNTNKRLTTTATDNTLAARSWGDSPNGTTTIAAKLRGI